MALLLIVVLTGGIGSGGDGALTWVCRRVVCATTGSSENASWPGVSR
jgi:hypothetical protein